jgi:hypothetical protein
MQKFTFLYVNALDESHKTDARQWLAGRIAAGKRRPVILKTYAVSSGNKYLKMPSHKTSSRIKKKLQSITMISRMIYKC